MGDPRIGKSKVISHNPRGVRETQSIFSPVVENSRAVEDPKKSTLISKFRNKIVAPNYVLTDQKQSGKGGLVTTLWKGEVRKSVSNKGVSMVFKDTEQMRQACVADFDDSGSAGGENARKPPKGDVSIDDDIDEDDGGVGGGGYDGYDQGTWGPAHANAYDFDDYGSGRKRRTGTGVVDGRRGGGGKRLRAYEETASPVTDVQSRCAVGIEGQANGLPPSIVHHNTGVVSKGILKRKQQRR